MCRPRIKVYVRQRSTNKVTNICDHRSGESNVIRTNTRDVCMGMIANCNQTITPLRTEF